MKTVLTDKAPSPVGPYSQAIESNGFIFCSGQIGIDPNDGKLVEGVEDQCRQAIKNLEQVLIACGSSLQNVVKTTIFLKNVDDFAAVNSIYSGLFTEKPARSTVEVSNLPGKAALVEIDAIAIK